MYGNIRFPLAPSSIITGAVTDEWGDPVRDAKVLLFQQSLFDGSQGCSGIGRRSLLDANSSVESFAGIEH